MITSDDENRIRQIINEELDKRGVPYLAAAGTPNIVITMDNGQHAQFLGFKQNEKTVKLATGSATIE